MVFPFLRRSTKDKYPIVTAKERVFVAVPRKPVQRNPQLDYKPLATRLPFLSVILLLVLACITAIELAFHYGLDTLDSSARKVGTRRGRDISVTGGDCAVIITVNILNIYYISLGSTTSSDVRIASQTASPTRPDCLMKRQKTTSTVTLATVSNAYVYDGSASSSNSSSSFHTTLPSATTAGPYASEVAVTCYVTKYVEVEVTWASSTIPVGTSTSTGLRTGTQTNCATTSTVTMSASQNSYLINQKPTPTCTVTITFVIRTTTYSHSTTPVGATNISHSYDSPSSGCVVLTVTQVETAYLLDQTPIPSATSSSAYAADICLATVWVTKVETYQMAGTSTYSMVAGLYTSTPTGSRKVCSSTTTSTITSKVSVGVAITTESSAYAASSKPSSSDTYNSISSSVVASSPSPFISGYATPLTPSAPTGAPVSQISDGAYVTNLTPSPSTTSTLTRSRTSDETPTRTSESQSYIIGATPSASQSTITSEIYVPTGSSPGLSTETLIVEVFYTTLSPSPSVPSTTWVTVNETSRSATISATPTSTSAAAILSALEQSQLVLGTKYSNFSYFCANYLGVLMAIILKGLWAIVFANTKMMEPFCQLQKPDGASVSESLLANYLSPWMSWRSFKAIFQGQWVMLVTILTYGVTSLLSPIATETSMIMPTAMCTKDGQQRRCQLRWILEKPWTRALESVLGLIALLIIVFIALSWRRESGVSTNPSTIASMASLLHHRETMDEIRALDPQASDEVITQALSGSTYKIELYRNLDATFHYGLLKTDPVSPTAVRNRYNPVNNPNNLTMMNVNESHFTFRALRDTIFLLWVCALFGVVLGYYLAKGASPFNDFFNSGKWYPRFILTSVAVLINLHWKTLEREVRIITPYRRLSARRADPQRTILVPLVGTPFTSLIPSLWRGDIFHAFIAFVAITSDLLILAISGVPFSKTQVYKAFLISAYASMAVLSLMILTLLALFIWRMQNEKMRLPREPDTLLGVWLMLCNDKNGIRKEFKGVSDEVGMRSVSERCKREGRVYYAGWLDWDMREVDGPGGREVMAKDEVTRRFVVDRDGEGRVVGYDGGVN